MGLQGGRGTPFAGLGHSVALPPPARSCAGSTDPGLPWLDPYLDLRLRDVLSILITVLDGNRQKKVKNSYDPVGNITNVTDALTNREDSGR